MKIYTLDMQKEFGVKGGKLTCMLADYPWDRPQDAHEWKRPAVIILPGGGYSGISKREGEPVALEFLARGFHVFVLHYSIGTEQGYPYPEQLIELGVAVDYVKKNAEAFCKQRRDFCRRLFRRWAFDGESCRGLCKHIKKGGTGA